MRDATAWPGSRRRRERRGGKKRKGEEKRTLKLLGSKGHKISEARKRSSGALFPTSSLSSLASFLLAGSSLEQELPLRSLGTSKKGPAPRTSPRSRDDRHSSFGEGVSWHRRRAKRFFPLFFASLESSLFPLARDMLPTGAPKPPGSRGGPRRSPGGWSPVSNGAGASGGFNGINNNGGSGSASGGKFAKLLCLLALLSLAALGGAAVGRRTISQEGIDRVVGRVQLGEEAAKAMASSAKAALLKSSSKPMPSSTSAAGANPASSTAEVAGSPKGLLAPASSLPKVFLFIGILSGRGYRHRRLAVREAWSAGGNHPPAAVSKFVLSADEATPQVAREEAEFGDIVYVKERTNYKSILYKTYFIFEYAVEHYDVAFVLKTDDDAFVNVPPLLRLLGSLCETRDCSAERLYIGRMIQESEVLLAPGHKWNNAVFYNHTGVSRESVFFFF